MAWQPHLRSAFPHAYQGYACVSCVPGSPRYPHPLTRLCVWRLPPARLLIDPGVPGSTFHKRVANEIWSNYHDYVCARIKFADPTPDKQRTNEDEAAEDAANQAQQAQRYTIQAYLHRTRQPLELGL